MTASSLLPSKEECPTPSAEALTLACRFTPNYAEVLAGRIDALCDKRAAERVAALQRDYDDTVACLNNERQIAHERLVRPLAAAEKVIEAARAWLAEPGCYDEHIAAELAAYDAERHAGEGERK